MPAGRLPSLALAMLLAAAAPDLAGAAGPPDPAAAPAPGDSTAFPATGRSAVAATTSPPPPRLLLLPRAQEGPWLRSDRALHFGVSLSMSASWRVAGCDRGTAFGLSLGAGVVKEIYDATLRPAGAGLRGASRRDLVADLLGAAAGILVLDAIDR